MDGPVAAYAYDALGRRIAMRTPGAVSDEVTLYTFNDRWQVLMETDEEGAMRREFVYGNGIDEPLIMVNGMEAGTPKYYYLQDHLGSTIALLDSEGAIAEWYETDVYGRPTVYSRSEAQAAALPESDPLAFYADAAAGWLTEKPLFTTKGAKDHEETAGGEQPIFTMKDMKIMKETAGEVVAGGINWDGFVLQLAVFDPNTVLDTSYAMPVDPNSVIRRGDARVALLAESGGLKFETVAGDGIVSLTLHAVSAGGGSALGNPYLFTGRRVDWLNVGSEVKPIQINRHRYYDYGTGRWLSVDPFGYADGMNGYEYIKSSPGSGFDPFGLFTFEAVNVPMWKNNEEMENRGDGSIRFDGANVILATFADAEDYQRIAEYQANKVVMVQRKAAFLKVYDCCGGILKNKHELSTNWFESIISNGQSNNGFDKIGDMSKFARYPDERDDYNNTLRAPLSYNHLIYLDLNTKQCTKGTLTVISWFQLIAAESNIIRPEKLSLLPWTISQWEVSHYSGKMTNGWLPLKGNERLISSGTIQAKIEWNGDTKPTLKMTTSTQGKYSVNGGRNSRYGRERDWYGIPPDDGDESHSWNPYYWYPFDKSDFAEGVDSPWSTGEYVEQ